MLPVATVQEGGVKVPATGGEGVTGCDWMITFEDGLEIHPSALVTANVYVFAARPVIVVLAPSPLIVNPPGVTVIVHDPD
jgi:hypothetical protein